MVGPRVILVDGDTDDGGIGQCHAVLRTATAQPGDQLAHSAHLGRRGDGFLGDSDPFAQPGEIQYPHGHSAPLAGNSWSDASCGLAAVVGRSEEHTSELQSLMRISYAVFCLKKNKKSET